MLLAGIELISGAEVVDGEMLVTKVELALGMPVAVVEGLPYGAKLSTPLEAAVVGDVYELSCVLGRTVEGIVSGVVAGISEAVGIEV